MLSGGGRAIYQLRSAADFPFAGLRPISLLQGGCESSGWDTRFMEVVPGYWD